MVKTSHSFSKTVTFSKQLLASEGWMLAIGWFLNVLHDAHLLI